MVRKMLGGGGAVNASTLAGRIALGSLLALPTVAQGADVAIKLEPGVAIPLTSPQTDVYDVGGGQSLKLLFGLGPYLDIGPSATFLLLPAARDGEESGVVWGLGGGLRVKRPHDAKSYRGVSPWFDADLLYIRTGELNRPGFDAGVGLSVPIGASRAFWAGPFVRYLQVFQGERAGYDSGDAQILSIGASLEFGPGLDREVASTEPPQVAAREVIVNRDVVSCPDRDGDTIPDTIDRCPDVVGKMDTYGCPTYQKVVVKPDKLELKEKLYFAWDQATLEEASFPVLDEVAQALKDSPSSRVQVEGHADSSGGDDHNQALSERRAEAVLDYLAAHGIAKDRLVSKGFSSSVPRDTNETVSGRQNNRRVEFVVNFILLNSGDAK